MDYPVLIKSFATELNYNESVDKTATKHSQKINSWIFDHPWVRTISMRSCVRDAFIWTDVQYVEDNNPQEELV